MERESSRTRTTSPELLQIFEVDEIAQVMLDKISNETAVSLSLLCRDMYATIRGHLQVKKFKRGSAQSLHQVKKVVQLRNVFDLDLACKFLLDKLPIKSVGALAYTYPGLLQNPLVLENLLTRPSQTHQQPQSSSSSLVTHPKPELSFQHTLSAIFDDKVMHHMLSFLPVKILIKFKRVSRSWELLPSNPSFIKSHLLRSKAQPKVYILTADHGRSIIISSPKLGYEGGEVVFKASIPWAAQSAMLEPVNGLFCFVDEAEHSSRVYNIETGQITPWVSTSMRLQRERTTMIPTYGFGFDPTTGKHKVLCTWEICRDEPGYGVMVGKPDYSCEVFTVGEKEYRRIDEAPPVMLYKSAVYANGSIYRLNRDHDYFKAPDEELIVAFDLGTERFRLIHIPTYIIDSSVGKSIRKEVELLQVDGHITIMDRVHETLIKLWISDDSFTKREKATNWTVEEIELPFKWEIGYSLQVLAVEGTNKLIMETPISSSERSPRGALSFFLYDRISKERRYIDITGISPLLKYPFYFGMTSFYESLVPIKNAEKEVYQSTPPV